MPHGRCEQVLHGVLGSREDVAPEELPFRGFVKLSDQELRSAQLKLSTKVETKRRDMMRLAGPSKRFCTNGIHPFSCHRERNHNCGMMVPWTPTSHPVTSRLKNRPCSTQAPEDSMPAHQWRPCTSCSKCCGEGSPCGALSTSPGPLGKPNWTRGSAPHPRSDKRGARTHRNRWFVVPTCGLRWTYATRSVEGCGAIIYYYCTTAAASGDKDARVKAKEEGKVGTTISQRRLGLSQVEQSKKRRTTLVRGATASYTPSTLLQDRS